MSEIQKFYHNSTVLVTGGTGFLGKLLVDKLLRSCQSVNHIYLIMRNKNGITASERMEKYFEDPVFTRAKLENPTYKSQVTVIQGDMECDNLNLIPEDTELLIKNVTIIFHAAASVNFVEKIRVAVELNVDGVRKVMNLAQQMKQLKSFVHISTVYSNCHLDMIEEKLYPMDVKYEEIVNLLRMHNDEELSQITPQLQGKSPNIYTFTKALAERYIADHQSGLPLGIFRPAINVNRSRSCSYECSQYQMKTAKGQALCSHCRENTHRAKMFASHEIMHMSKCIREPRRCPLHGEQYIMYSPVQHSMLCVNCFRDTPSEIRAQCVDMDTAHVQASKRLERGQAAILDLQGSVRDGLIALKGLLDELRRNMESEKHTINTFCQGMQEAMAKTHAAMIMEVQRQFESKERTFRAQLVALGTVMPVLQIHLILCATFTNAANKYQFLELCPAILERLANVGQLSQPVRPLQSAVIRTNYRNEFAQNLEPWVGRTNLGQQHDQTAATRVYETAEQSKQKQQPTVQTKPTKLLDGEGPFATHCRTFETTLRELSQQLCGVKERVGELHRDITALRKAQAPPLTIRYECVNRDCAMLDENLDRQQQELERLAGIFNASWEEQLWRLRVEQEVFNCQRADILTLRNELKHLSTVALQLEPYIKSLTQPADDQTQQHLQSLLEHIGLLQSNEAQKLPRSRSRILGQLIDKVRPGSGESRERSKSVGQTETTKPTSQKSKKSQSQPQQQQTGQQYAQHHQQQQLDRLETHLKEKIHDIMCRRQSKMDHAQESSISDDRKLSKTDLEQITKLGGKSSLRHHKKIGKSCDKINTCSKLSEMSDKKKCGSESDYQRISDATSQSVKALVHKESRSSPSSPKCKNKRKPKVYPYSDGEDNVFYNRHDSADSLSTMSVNSRRSSLECPDKTLVVVIGARKKPLTLAQKQRSWETFPPKRRHHICKAQTPPASTPLRKTDSFEGHEEAVKTLVAAVQETRRKPKSSN